LFFILLNSGFIIKYIIEPEALKMNKHKINKILFIYPGQLEKAPFSGSSLRPIRLLEGFKSLGLEMDIISGDRKQREKTTMEIIRKIRNGYRYLFTYMESLNLPVILSDPSHIPYFPVYEYLLLKLLKAKNIPIGIYYRDIHWKFDIFRKRISFLKGLLAYPFFYYEWSIFTSYTDIIFVPHQKIADYLPQKNKKKPKLVALPPGCENPPQKEITRSTSPRKELKLLYVGGITPPLYNLSLMFKALEHFKHKNIKLTICTREGELEKLDQFYTYSKLSNIRFVSKKANQLKELYTENDLVLLTLKPHTYYRFAMPVKLFEAIGYLKPIITIKNTAMGDFVEKGNIGWTIDPDPESIAALLTHLLNHPEVIAEKKENVEKIRRYHTWEQRAKAVIEAFEPFFQS